MFFGFVGSMIVRKLKVLHDPNICLEAERRFIKLDEVRERPSQVSCGKRAAWGILRQNPVVVSWAVISLFGVTHSFKTHETIFNCSCWFRSLQWRQLAKQLKLGRHPVETFFNLFVSISR